MKNLIKIFFLFLIGPFYKIEAQQVVKKDTLSGTELTMSMDKNINQLLESTEENCARINDKSHPSKNEIETVNNTPRVVTPKIYVPKKPQSQAEICRQNPKISGYKIQLVVVKSNDEAQKVKAYFRNRFPYLKVETDASLRPNYKVLAGSYLNKESASRDLKQIRQYYKSAIPVQYRVFCVEAK